MYRLNYEDERGTVWSRWYATKEEYEKALEEIIPIYRLHVETVDASWYVDFDTLEERVQYCLEDIDRTKLKSLTFEKIRGRKNV
jgi:hypothetical protein